jgi:hypothetical protein
MLLVPGAVSAWIDYPGVVSTHSAVVPMDGAHSVVSAHGALSARDEAPLVL